ERRLSKPHRSSEPFATPWRLRPNDGLTGSYSESAGSLCAKSRRLSPLAYCVALTDKCRTYLPKVNSAGLSICGKQETNWPKKVLRSSPWARDYRLSVCFQQL